jgi:aminoglycoside phosphotransferase family enzyme
LHESTFWDFGHDLGQRHANLPRVHEGYDPARPMLDNFSTLARLTEPELSRMVKRIYGHMQVVLKRLVPLLLARNDEGFVRECLGDLHLGNLMCANGVLQAFDCIEFDPKLRCIDVWADVAFLFMDLSVRGRSDLAYSYIDGYLNSTGDYDGARLLPLLSAYRALVRAKVNTLRYEQCGDASLMEAVIANLNWVEQRQQKKVGKIIITHGLSGSGKSFWAKKLLATFPLIRLRSDVFRKSHFGLEISAKSNLPNSFK